MVLQNILWVGLGGFLGANARYLLGLWITARFSNWMGWALPSATAFVNISGSLLLALFLTWAAQRANVSENVKLLIGTGFFGAYTTFSTYANESITLLADNWRLGVTYIILTNTLCLLGALAGIWLANRWFTA